MRFKESFMVIMICCSLGLSVGNEQCKKGRSVIGAIVGGERAQKGEWRWMVAFIHMEKGNYFCSGSLISNRHILSGKSINFYNEKSDKANETQCNN